MIGENSNDLRAFSENSAAALLKENKPLEFFNGLNYPVEMCTGRPSLNADCPCCGQPGCFIGLNGRVHKIFWKCANAACRSNAGEVCRDLLGLVRELMPDKRIGTAKIAIKTFLGSKPAADVAPTDDWGWGLF